MNDIEKKIDELGNSVTTEENNTSNTTNKKNSLSNKPKPFLNPIPQNQIGHIIAGQDGLKIGREENTVFAVLYSEKAEEIEVGDYVRIPYYDVRNEDDDVEEQLLASIETLRYNTQFNDTRGTSSNSYNSEQYSYIAELEPISLISVDEDAEDDESQFIGAYVSKPPKPTVKIDTVSNNEFLRCGLDVPKEGIYVGDIAVNGERIPNSDNPLEYYLFNPTTSNDSFGEPTIFRHVLVAGSTGTGKTHTSKNIIRQFAQPFKYEIDVPAKDSTTNKDKRERQLNITIIDPEEEYAQMGENPENKSDMERIEKFAKNRKDLQYGGIGDKVDFKVYAPKTKYSNISELTNTNSAIHEFGIPFEIVKYNKRLLMPDDPQGPTRQAINELLNMYFDSAGNNPTYEKFKQSLFENKTRLEEEGNFSETILDAAARRMKKPVYSEVFDQSVNKLSDESFTKDIFKEGQVSVITTGHLQGEAEKLIIQALSTHIVDNKIGSNVPEKYVQIKGTPLILVLDEAHEYVDTPQTTTEEYIIDKFRQAARRGRKDLFGLYFISQNPEDIDDEVRNQLNTKIYLQLQDRVVNSSDVYIPPKFRKQISQFDKGQMMIDQPGVQPVELMGLDTCLTKHTK